jgi:predicted TIM-barrel fold metal-dependent hydrolase
MELAIRYPEWVEIVDSVIVGASADERRRLFRGTAIEFYRLDR